MKINELIKVDGKIYRVLKVGDSEAICINITCTCCPKKISLDTEYEVVDHTVLEPVDDDLTDSQRAVMFSRFTAISTLIPVVGERSDLNNQIALAAEMYGVSEQTLRNYLYRYLVFQRIECLAPRQSVEDHDLTLDQKNMRWALNKFYYTRRKNSLAYAYRMMLKERYTNSDGELNEDHPTIHQFRYFFKTYNSRKKELIAREGIKNYEMNHRPLLNSGVELLANTIGYAEMDTTVCDIYLVNESGKLVGRPLLAIAVDAYSGIIIGYSLSWEGGVYSLQRLMLNCLADKVEHCKSFGIAIEKEDWDTGGVIPGVFLTDRGTEYTSSTFEQMTELGVRLVNLPAYRAELKGTVEKTFDILQDLYKPILKARGVIKPDFQIHGERDYRKDACLTMRDFEKILLYCIVYINSKRVLNNFKFTPEMIAANIPPTSCGVWNYQRQRAECPLIPANKDELLFTLMPRTEGKITRKGLVVNKIRYTTDQVSDDIFLTDADVMVSYNPDNVNNVWLRVDGSYIQFDLIDDRFKDMSVDKAWDTKNTEREFVKKEEEENLKANVKLLHDIETVIEPIKYMEDVELDNMSRNNEIEIVKKHEQLFKELIIE